jgi:NAD(P)-dependent dehydrogenase (short-subunit alcohol dehydrogenase family)
MPGMATVAAINGAIEALCRTLAIELAPVRVNVISQASPRRRLIGCPGAAPGHVQRL